MVNTSNLGLQITQASPTSRTPATKPSGAITTTNESELPSPVKPTQLEHHLLTARYSETKIQYLVKGFTEGFRLDHTGPVLDTSP